MAAIGDIVFDAQHPATLARFWAAVLDGYEIAPYGDEELDRLRSLGIEDPEDDPTVLVTAPEGPRLWFQRVPEAKVAKNRVHLDLRASDVESESARLLELGAVLATDQRSRELTVFHDPEGNEFCLLH